MAGCAGGVCSVAGNNYATTPLGLQQGGQHASIQNLGSKKNDLGKSLRMNLFDPQQAGLLDQISQLLGGQLGRPNAGLGPLPAATPNANWQKYFNFAPIEAEARNQFQTQTIPSLAERFTAMGGEGGQRSSAFQASLGRAGAGLEQGLAALKAQYALPQAQLALQQQGLGQNQQQIGLQGRGQQLDLLRTLMTGGLAPRFETNYIPKEPSGWSKFAGQAGGAVIGAAAKALPLLFI